MMVMFVGVVLLIAAFYWSANGPRSDAVAESSKHGEWRAIEYRGVLVSIPAEWQLLATEGCEFPFERWAPPGTPACDPDAAGVGFYGAATGIMAHGPGVRRTELNGRDAPTWAGYVYAGNYVVHASSNDRDLVEQVLDSARTA